MDIRSRTEFIFISTWGLHGFPSEYIFPQEDQRDLELIQIRRHHVDYLIIPSLKILLTPHNVICLDDTNYDLTSADINGILAVINSRCRASQVDYWLPVCLPSITSEGYLNMYYRNLAGTSMGLVLVSSSNDNVADAVMMCQKIEIVGSATHPESRGGKDH